MHRPVRMMLVIGAALGAPQIVTAQPAPGPAPGASTSDTDDSDIVVRGQPARGSAIGDIPPETVLSSRDVKATGVTSLDELLDAIAPEIGVARASGSPRPLLLLNGRKV